MKDKLYGWKFSVHIGANPKINFTQKNILKIKLYKRG
jgi:hypothetical protein